MSYFVTAMERFITKIFKITIEYKINYTDRQTKTRITGKLSSVVDDYYGNK